METFKPWGIEQKAFLMLMHLSQLAGFILPGAGFILPIVMWATNKDESVEIDQHGKVILNWMFSLLIYSFVSAILIVIVIGFLGLIALALINFIFVILAAVKANDGELWRYPLSIQFFTIDKSIE